MGNKSKSEPMHGFGLSMGFLAFVLIGWLYEAILTSSRLQATTGKLLLDLRVVRTSFDRVGFVDASIRHFGKYVSYLVLGIGFLMIASRHRKQGWHDEMAKTYVIYAP